jgi:translation initiation factor 2 subunit 1
MLLKRQGMPEEGEFVLCTVTNIQYNSVFVKLNEYEKSGMIHISEISPGRIRNIRDFVEEGKVVVCVVLRINEERGYIDLSLRRVNEMEKKKKSEKIKQEQKAEKIIENYAKANNMKLEQLYASLATPILKKYEYLHSAFFDIVEKKTTLLELGIPQAIAEPFEKVVIDKIKPKSVVIEGSLKLELYLPNGVDVLKTMLTQQEDNSTTLKYEGGGKYRITVTSKEYKIAEQVLKQKVDALEKSIEKNKGLFAFERFESKKVA